MRVINQSGYPLKYSTDGSIGLDLHAVLEQGFTLAPQTRAMISTGISLELPEGHGALVQPRSGMTGLHGIVAATGVIDQDWRGIIKVALFNLGRVSYWISPGDRIAQLVVFPVSRVAIEDATELSETARGANGFGSSGR